MRFEILKTKFFRSTIIYSFSSILNASIPFFLLPILTKHFSPADYGKISMATILINFITPFIGISSHGAVHRRFFEDEKHHFSRYIGNVLLILFASLLIMILLVYMFRYQLIEITFLNENILFICLLIALGQFINLLILSIWQAKNQALRYGIYQISLSLLNFGLSIYLIFQLEMNWEGRLYAQLISAIVFLLLSLLILIKSELITLKFNLEDIKDILKFSLPLIPHTLGGLAIALTDRVLIANMIGVAETGVYTVAFQIGSIINLVNTSIISAYVPWLFEKLKLNDQNVNIKIVRYTYIYFILSLIFSSAFIFIIPNIMSLFLSKEYGGSYFMMIGIVIGYVFNGFYLMVAGFIFYKKQTYYLSIVTFTIAVINIPLCYSFILKYGAVGASYSMTIVYLISFIATWILSNKIFPMPWFKFSKI